MESDGTDALALGKSLAFFTKQGIKRPEHHSQGHCQDQIR